MYSEWTKHLKDTKQKENFEKMVYGSKILLDRQKAILDERERQLDRSETNINTYDTPNWDVRQAHKNGYRECLQYLKMLVDIDSQQPPTMEPK